MVEKVGYSFWMIFTMKAFRGLVENFQWSAYYDQHVKWKSTWKNLDILLKKLVMK